MPRRNRPDSSLDLFRLGVASLALDGDVRGHLASTVETFWGLGRPFRLQERVWLLLTWSSGARERIIEDHPPWTTVGEVKRGEFVWHSPQGEPVNYSVKWLRGTHRDQAWEKYGINDDVGAYM